MKATVVTARGSFRSPSFEHARVGDEMRRGLISCSPDTPLRDVARTMTTNHVHAVVVSDPQAGGATAPWGIVSDVDLLRVAETGAELFTAGEAAATPVVMVSPDDPLARAAKLMRERATTHVVVVDPLTGQPVGVLSTLDIAGALAWGEG